MQSLQKKSSLKQTNSRNLKTFQKKAILKYPEEKKLRKSAKT